MQSMQSREETFRRFEAYFVFVSRSKPPPRWRCSATAAATRSVASGDDSACRASCSIRRRAAECRCVSALLKLLTRTLRNVGVNRKGMCSDLRAAARVLDAACGSWMQIVDAGCACRNPGTHAMKSVSYLLQLLLRTLNL